MTKHIFVYRGSECNFGWKHLICEIHNDFGLCFRMRQPLESVFRESSITQMLISAADNS